MSSARQAGLEACTGDWIIHADPDDFVELNMVEVLCGATENPAIDMVICDYYYNADIYKLSYRNVNDLLMGIVEGRYTCCLWNTMVKRSFIVSHKISFMPTWLCHSEDLLFIVRLLSAGAKTFHISSPLYHYINRVGSLVTTRSEKALCSEIYFISELEKILDVSCYDKLFWRKRFAIVYAYEGRYFKYVSKLFPEIKTQLLSNGNNDWGSQDSQLARCMKYPPSLVWLTAKVYEKSKKIFRKLFK